MKREISQKVDNKILNLGNPEPATAQTRGFASTLLRHTRSATCGVVLSLSAVGIASAPEQVVAAVRPSPVADIPHYDYVSERPSPLAPFGPATVETADHQVASASTKIKLEKVQHPIELDVDISRTVIPNHDSSALANTGTVVHHVRSGETLVEISKQYNVSVAAIIQANNIDDPAALQTNDVLRIPTHQLVAQAATDDVTADVNQRIALNRSEAAISTLEAGSSSEKTFRVAPDIEAPAIARRTLLPQVTTLDLPPLESSDTYLPGRTLQMPAGEFKYIWPAKGVFTSGYGPRWGRMHRGIDIAAPVGTTVVASAPGVVKVARWNSGGYGNLVEIHHPDGSFTRYAHNNRIMVQEGQPVNQGEKIAEMGSTGRSTGPHTHFEIRKPGRGAVNPMNYLKRRS